MKPIINIEFAEGIDLDTANRYFQGVREAIDSDYYVYRSF